LSAEGTCTGAGLQAPVSAGYRGLYRLLGLVFIEKHEPVKAMHSFQDGLSLSEHSSSSEMILKRIDFWQKGQGYGCG